MDLFIIDAIGPFFRDLDSGRINWSKIPFEHLPVDGNKADKFWRRVGEDFATVVSRTTELGYNAITLDNIAHLTPHPWYEPEVLERVQRFNHEFKQLLPALENSGQRLFLTSDVLTTTPAIDQRLGDNKASMTAYYCDLVAQFFDEFPTTEGLILRIGESDGLDIGDPLRSRLHLRTARETNDFLRKLLPVFEARGKQLILRTWTVGAHRVGDLIWHRKRQHEALNDLASDALILSMKPGESDFFRYLPLNKAFYRYQGPKILELQARREYEGAGEFPSFIGWDCERLREELHSAENLRGISVWCQTGGWHHFHRLTFLKNHSPWVELNCRSAISVFKHGKTAETAIESMVGKTQATAATELLRHSEYVIHKLYYIEPFARQKLFFRRVRIPPLLHLYWDTLFIHSSVRRIMRHFVQDHDDAINEGESALLRFDRMLELVEDTDLPLEDIRFMRDTCTLIALARRYYFEPYNEDTLQHIRTAKKDYKERWPGKVRPRYRIKTNFHLPPFSPRSLRLATRVLLRRKRGYRIIDRVFTLSLLSIIYRLLRERSHKALPKFLRKSAMGVDSLFE